MDPDIFLRLEAQASLRVTQSQIRVLLTQVPHGGVDVDKNLGDFVRSDSDFPNSVERRRGPTDDCPEEVNEVVHVSLDRCRRGGDTVRLKRENNQNLKKKKE